MCVFPSFGRGQLVFGVDNAQLPVYYLDISTGDHYQLFLPWLNGADGISGMTAVNEQSKLFYTANQELYSVLYDTLIPTLIGKIKAGEDYVYMLGLAWDTDMQRLLGIARVPVPGIYEINTTTGETQLLLHLDSGYRFGSLGYQPDTKLLFAGNDKSSSFYRGIYTIDLGTGALEYIAGFPDNYNEDLDGLTITENTIYLTTDNGNHNYDTVYVYDLETNLYKSGYRGPYYQRSIYSGTAWATGLQIKFLISNPDVGITDDRNIIHVRAASSGATIEIYAGKKNGKTNVPGCSDLKLSIANAELVGTAVADSEGKADVIIFSISHDISEGQLWLQGVDKDNCKLSPVTVHNYPKYPNQK